MEKSLPSNLTIDATDVSGEMLPTELSIKQRLNSTDYMAQASKVS